METVKTVFVFGVMAVLAGLLIDALLTGSVWVKGTRGGAIDYRVLAHRRRRAEEPASYWFAVGFYALALAVLGGVQLIE